MSPEAADRPGAGVVSPEAVRSVVPSRTDLDPLDRLQALRQQIDALDDQLLALVAARASVVDEIAALKGAAGIPMRDPERERRITERLGAARPARLSADGVAGVVRAVLAACLPADRATSRETEDRTGEGR